MTTAAGAASLSLIVVLVLLALLIQKELTLPAKTDRVQRLGQSLNVAIVPLLITFIVIAIFRIAEVLS